MQAIKHAAIDAMQTKRDNISMLTARREALLDDLTKVHCEIGYAKKDLQDLESDFKNLTIGETKRSNLSPNCGIGSDRIDGCVKPSR